jgi:uncharacterized SAM-binding protein YcdF (DUF218 family)
MVARFVKRFLIPGSMSFLAAGLAVAALLLGTDLAPRAFANAWLASLVAIYWLLSLPAVAHALIRGLQGRHGTVRTADDARGARVVVGVGNGSVTYTDGVFAVDQLTRRSTFCVFEVARLCALLRPSRIVVSGGPSAFAPCARPESELMRDLLVRFNVDADRILLDTASRTTEQQAENVARLLAREGCAGPVVVVTTAAHMPRVMKLFVAHGVDAIASVTPDLRYDEGRTRAGRFLPSAAALRGSESAMYEYIALVHAAYSSSL